MERVPATLIDELRPLRIGTKHRKEQWSVAASESRSRLRRPDGSVGRRPDGSVGMALVLPALTDCWWWFESLLVHSGVSSATRRKATGADKIKKRPDGSVGMALVLPALTDCRWWFESLLVHSGVSSATRRKATGAEKIKNESRSRLSEGKPWNMLSSQTLRCTRALYSTAWSQSFLFLTIFRVFPFGWFSSRSGAPAVKAEPPCPSLFRSS